MKTVRRAAVLAFAGLLACLPCPAEQPAPPLADNADAPFTLPEDSRLAVKLNAAAEYIHDEDWGKAVRVLQQVLDLDENRTAVIGDDKNPRTVSALAEAQRLLAALPPAGRKAYQEAQGPRAADFLKEAIKYEDEAKLTAVMRRFYCTDSTADALEALARLRYDGGRYTLAALSYRRLLDLRDAAKWSPESLLRAADVFHRTGDKEHAEQVAKPLLNELGTEGLEIGGRKINRDELQKELNTPVEASGEWSMFGGDAGRSAQGNGDIPFLYRHWTSPTTASFPDHAEYYVVFLEELFKRASDRLAQLNQPVLPPQFPVTATVTMKRGGLRHSLVVVRTHAGIAAYDLDSGKLLGVALIKGSFEWMMSNSKRRDALDMWTGAYDHIVQDRRPGVVFENTLIGTLSIDGDIAYTVQDLVLPPPASSLDNKGLIGLPGGPNPSGWPPDLLDAVGHNCLMAYDLSAGCKGVWDEKIFDDPKSELGGGFFLSPPLLMNGLLFVLHEKDGQLRLLCLENVQDVKGTWNPRLVFVTPLGTVKDGLSAKLAPRRLQAAQIAYGDGILVCPTHAGTVVGVDLLTRSVAWVYRYQEPAPAPPPNPMPPAAPPVGWRNGAPVVSGDAVVLAEPDGGPLACLDLKTGAPRWKQPRGDDDLYLAGAFDGRVIVVGAKDCRAYNLADGKPLWTLATGVPSGWGAAAGGVYYLPLSGFGENKEPEVCAIDLAKGQIVGHTRTPAGKEPRPVGNLIFYHGDLISQTMEEVVAYPPHKDP